MQYHVHPVVFANECDGMEDERMKMGKGWKPGEEVPLRLGRGLEGVSHIWTWGKEVEEDFQLLPYIGILVTFMSSG